MNQGTPGKVDPFTFLYTMSPSDAGPTMLEYVDSSTKNCSGATKVSRLSSSTAAVLETKLTKDDTGSPLTTVAEQQEDRKEYFRLRVLFHPGIVRGPSCSGERMRHIGLLVFRTMRVSLCFKNLGNKRSGEVQLIITISINLYISLVGSNQIVNSVTALPNSH